jgi:outer membrane protein assembly factor BamB
LREFEEFFKKIQKSPPESAWTNIQAALEYKERQNNISSGVVKSKAKSRLIFAFSFILLTVIISAFIYLRFVNKSPNRFLPQKAIAAFVSGKAEIETAGGEIIKIKVGTELTDAYVVRTREKSKLQIKLSGGSVVSLFSDTEIKISSLLKRKGRVERTSVELYRGGILAEPVRVEENGNFNVSTPTAVAGVRGTKFFVGYSSEAEATKIAVQRGKVHVTRRIPLEVNKGVKAKIVKAIGASKNVVRGQSVYITRSENERIGDEVARRLDDIQRQIGANESIENIDAVKRAKSLSAIKVSAFTGDAISVFNDNVQASVPAADAVQKVKVTISSMNGKLFVNGQKIAGRSFVSAVEAGSILRVKIVKKGFKTYTSAIRVPEGIEQYTPDIILERVILPRQRVITLPERGAISPAPMLPDAPVIPEIKFKEITLKRVHRKHTLAIKAVRNPVADKNSIYFYSSSNIFVSSGISGVTNWKFVTAALSDVYPAIDKQAVYIADRSGYIYAISKHDGSLIWKKKYGTLLYNSKIVIKSSRLYFGTSQGYVYAVNKKTGKIVWKFEAGGGVWGSVAVFGGNVYTGCEDGNVYALNRDTGLLVWKKKLGERIISSPVMYEQRLYINSYSGRLYCLNIKDAEVYWSKNIGEDLSSVLINSRRVFVQRKNAVEAFDALTGKKLFTKTVTGIRGFSLYKGALFAVSSGGRISEISFDGIEVWSHTFEQSVIGKPLIINGRPALIIRDGKLLELNRVLKKTMILRNR